MSCNSGCFRIISTYVENTSLVKFNVLPGQDHLHIRGEYTVALKNFEKQLGSSPHTWRILFKASSHTYHTGIISTYVENTSLVKFNVLPGQDHLHIRGEYLRLLVDAWKILGSSPHTWRILFNAFASGHNSRIISTYVENTHPKLNLKMRKMDHLHIRGEYYFQTLKVYNLLGSSPHTWRILVSAMVAAIGLRIISTYVENTSYSHCRGSYYQDHLHIRGEYQLTILEKKAIKGSFPHTWRIQAFNHLLNPQHGIISTYVENTQLRHLVKKKQKDHLHIRGEYFLIISVFITPLGSSPHTWRILQ